MQIQLNQVLPPNIPEAHARRSDVWGADLVLPSGSKVLVNAPSGSGKTTLIHLLYGLRRTFSGDYVLGSTSTSTMKRADWATVRQTKFSVVFQDLRLFLHATAHENIQLKAGLQPVKDKVAIDRMAERLGMQDKMNRPVSTLSQGERQRIAIIRAMCQPFEWLLLDEPFSHLDEANIAIARQLMLERITEEGAGFLLAGLGFDYGFQTNLEIQL